MADLDIKRILQTCIETNGADVFLVPGIVPLVRLHDGPRELAIPDTVPEDVLTLLAPIAPNNLRTRVAQEGRVKFDYPHLDRYPFTVEIFRIGSSAFVIISRVFQLPQSG